MKSILKYILCCLLLLAPSFTQAGEAILSTGVSIFLRLGGVPGGEAAQVSGDYTISNAGTLSLPHLKTPIRAVGLRPTELAEKIEAAYKNAEIYTNPNIAVKAAGASVGGDLVISVGGEVRQPRPVGFRPGLDLFGAISEAGGPTEFADMRKVKIIRDKKETIIDMRKVTAENSIELIAGDKVIVPGG